MRILTPVLCLAFAALSFGASENLFTEIKLKEVTLESGLRLQYAERGYSPLPEHGNGYAHDYALNGATDREPLRKQVVIFLHGYLDSWFSFKTVMENLPPSYHAYAITQRGHGDSDKPESGYEMTDFANDVADFMDHFGIVSAHIVGHSMGSVIAQRFAIDYPERVRKLVLIGSGADITTNAALLDFEAFVVPLVAPLEREVVDEFQSSTIVGVGPEGFMTGIIDESMKVPLFVWKAALIGLNNANHLAELGQIKASTLVAWGDHDELFLARDQQDLLNGIPDVRILIYKNVGHSIQWESHLQFTLDLISFLDYGP